MVHSVELLLDPHTEAAVRRVWQRLSDAGLPGLRSPAPTSRPHVTLVVAERISPAVDEPLSAALAQLPLACVIGAPLLFGRSPLILVRLVVPSAPLLSLHAAVLDICTPYLEPGPAPNTVAGQWTPHVTMARRVEPAALPRAVSIAARDIKGRAVGLRRWDGDKRVEHLIG